MFAQVSAPGPAPTDLKLSFAPSSSVSCSQSQPQTLVVPRETLGQARLKARLVYIYEYTFLLGQIRRDDMPALDNGADGWRMGSRKKIQVTEPKAKKYAKEVEKAWKAIEKNYKDTPWAILAYREGLVALGLEWKAKKE